MPSIAEGAGAIARPAKPAISSLIGSGGPSREWWAGFGTVAAALDGFRFVAFDAK